MGGGAAMRVSTMWGWPPRSLSFCQEKWREPREVEQREGVRVSFMCRRFDHFGFIHGALEAKGTPKMDGKV